jgi:small subunit ribosomal protein S17
VKKVSKFKAHDTNNECKIGDGVKIIETRPLSKDKRWLVLEILGKPVRSSKT